VAVEKVTGDELKGKTNFPLLIAYRYHLGDALWTHFSISQPLLAHHHGNHWCTDQQGRALDPGQLYEALYFIKEALIDWWHPKVILSIYLVKVHLSPIAFLSTVTV